MTIKDSHFLERIDFLLSKKILIPTLIGFLPFLFIGTYKSTVNQYLVKDILSNIESNLFSDIIFGTITALILLDVFRKLYRNYIISRYFFGLITLLIACYYLFFRFFDNEWNYLPYSLCEKIAYADLIIVYWLGQLLILITQRNHANKNKQTSGFLGDIPIEKNQLDNYGRLGFAEALSKRILDTYPTKVAFAIGITAPWGCGKTTFLNFIENELRDKGDTQNQIIIKFNPWQFDNSINLVDDFFSTVKTNLSPFNAELSNQIGSYVDKLNNIQSNIFTKFTKVGINTLSKEKSLDDLFQDINSTIEKLGKQLIIFIDDLDRLDEEEIIEVIRLVRNTANFKNTIFILAYDREYVNNAIKKINSHRHEKFLEKIFQMEISLPITENITTKNYIYEELKNGLKIKDDVERTRKNIDLLDFYFGKSQNQIRKYRAIRLISNIREANKLVNSFLLMYDQLAGEVVFSDLLNIEVLRIKYPQIYDIVSVRRTFFFAESRVIRKSLEEYTSSKLRESYKDKTEEKNTPYNLSTHLEDELKYSKEDREKIITFFENIFNGRQAKPNSIVYVNSFGKYFAYRLISGQLSSVKFIDAILNKKQHELDETFIQWFKDDHLKGLKYRLKHFETTLEIDSKEIFEKLTRSYFLLGNHISLKDDVNLFFDEITLVRLLEWGAKFYKNPSHHISFIQTLFKDAKPPYEFERRIFVIHQESFKYKDFILSSTFTKTLLVNYVHKYLENSTNFTIQLGRLFRTTQMESLKSTNPQLDKESKEKLLKFIKEKDPIGFFQYMVFEESGNKLFDNIMPPYSVDKNSICYDLFTSLKELTKFYQTINTSSQSLEIQEINKFLESYSSSDGLMNFDFKHIKVTLPNRFAQLNLNRLINLI